MMRHFIALVSMLIFGAGTVHAQDTAIWKEINGWSIGIDRTLNFGCFIYGVYERGTSIRVGLNQADQNGYILVGNPGWQSLEQGKKYDLSFQFDRDPPWSGPASAIVIDGKPSLVLPFNKAEFFRDFAEKQTLFVRYQNTTVATLNLRGSYAAVQELLTCQETVEKMRKKPGQEQSGDPFAPAVRRDNSDPFKQ